MAYKYVLTIDLNKYFMDKYFSTRTSEKLIEGLQGTIEVIQNTQLTAQQKNAILANPFVVSLVETIV